jgi:hypothetical protein
MRLAQKVYLQADYHLLQVLNQDVVHAPIAIAAWAMAICRDYWGLRILQHNRCTSDTISLWPLDHHCTS